MTYDRTLVANLCMAHLGDQDIDDIDDARDRNAIILKRNYEHARNVVYEAHDWKWGKRVAQLQLLVDAPLVRYTYAYALPPSYRRLTNVSEFSTMDPQLDDFDIVDRTVTTNSGSVFMEFVADDWSEAIWPAYFADCVALRLAIMCSARITHDLQNKQMLNKLFMEQMLPYARSVDGQAQPARRAFIRSNFTNARFGNRTSNLRRN